jgi:hypothetical protein
LAANIAPYAPLLLRSESAASSRIENLTASATAIALTELGDPTKHNAGIIVAITRAMQAALTHADDLDEQSILDVHAVLIGPTHPTWVGHWQSPRPEVGGARCARRVG